MDTWKRTSGKLDRLSRRAVVTGLGAAGLAVLAPVSGASKPADIAGFAPEPWFAETTRDLTKDLAAAAKADKYLALLWEQHGCHYCEELHKVNFKTPEIVALGKKHFHTLQMDLWGDREFVDFDTEKRAEKEVARGRFVRATPVMLFFDGDGDEVFRIPGYAPPPLFLAAYQFVIEQGFEDGSFRNWMAKRQSAG